MSISPESLTVYGLNHELTQLDEREHGLLRRLAEWDETQHILEGMYPGLSFSDLGYGECPRSVLQSAIQRIQYQKKLLRVELDRRCLHCGR